MRVFRAPVLIACLFLFSVNAVHGQTGVVPAVPTPEGFDWKWIVTQGGLSGLTLVILWSYRRDMMRLHDDDQRKQNELFDTLKAATVALTAHTEVSREQIAAQAELTKAIERCRLAQQVFQG